MHQLSHPENKVYALSMCTPLPWAKESSALLFTALWGLAALRKCVKSCCCEPAHGLVHCCAEAPWVPPHQSGAAVLLLPDGLSILFSLPPKYKMWSVFSITGKSVKCRLLIVCSEHVTRGWIEGHNVMNEIFPSSSGNGWAISNSVTPHHTYTLKELDIPRLDLYK